MTLQKVKLSMQPGRFTAIALGSHHVPRRTVIAETLGLRRFASTLRPERLAAMMGIAGGGWNFDFTWRLHAHVQTKSDDSWAASWLALPSCGKGKVPSAAAKASYPLVT